MADAALSPARRAFALGAIVLAGLAVGAAVGAGTLRDALELRLGALPSPGVATWIAAVMGILGAGLAVRSGLALRLIPALLFYVTAGAALTRMGPGVPVALLLAPLALWAVRLGKTARIAGAGLLLSGGVGGFAIGAPAAVFGTAKWNVSAVGVLVGLALAGVAVALADPGSATAPSSPKPARFDLRIALAIAGVVVVGFVVAFLLSNGTTYLVTPLVSGGAERPTPSVVPILLVTLTGLALVGFRRGRGHRATIGLVLTSVAMFAASARGLAPAAFLLVPLGLAAILEPCVRRAERFHHALPIGTLIFATLAGMPLAGTVVRGFTRIVRDTESGTAIPMGTNWAPVLIFYGLISLVVLLAHLAHAYEFDFAALDPADDRDPLPIVRKGLSRVSPKA